jgi:hypothetical protein
MDLFLSVAGRVRVGGGLVAPFPAPLRARGNCGAGHAGPPYPVRRARREEPYAMAREDRAAVRRELTRTGPGAGSLTERLVDEVREAVPAYRGLHPDRLGEVRAIIRWAAGRLLAMWVEDSTLTPADLERARAIGRARAADGHAADALVRAYRAGAAGLDRIVAEAGRGRLDAADAFALSRLWLSELETLVEALAGAHAEAARRLDADRDRARRDLLDDLLAGRQAGAAAIADRARALGTALPDPAALVVAAPTAPPRDASAQATATATALDLAARLADADPLATARAGQAVLLLAPAAAPAVGPLLRDRGWRGCVLTGPAPAEIASAYRLARDALETAPARAFDADGVLHTAEAHVCALLGGRPGTSPAAVRAHVLGALLAPGNAHLLATLDAYLRTGSATAAAETLHLHPQTLRYRMRRVRELSGRDPREPWQRFLLEVARTAGGDGAT